MLVDIVRVITEKYRKVGMIFLVCFLLGMKYTSYLLAYEDGTDRVFRKVGI
jgi:hypothetical protein